MGDLIINIAFRSWFGDGSYCKCDRPLSVFRCQEWLGGYQAPRAARSESDVTTNDVAEVPVRHLPIYIGRNNLRYWGDFGYSTTDEESQETASRALYYIRRSRNHFHRYRISVRRGRYATQRATLELRPRAHISACAIRRISPLAHISGRPNSIYLERSHMEEVSRYGPPVLPSVPPVIV